jgi:hypothetical protein
MLGCVPVDLLSVRWRTVVPQPMLKNGHGAVLIVLVRRHMRAAEQTPVCKSFKLHLRLAIRIGSRPLGAEPQAHLIGG